MSTDPSAKGSPSPVEAVRRYKGTRRGLPLDIWPAEDRARWRRLKEKHGLFDRQAILHRLEKPTVRGLEQSVGRFLGYLVHVRALTPEVSIGFLLTPDLVNDYAGFMCERLRAGSVHEELRRLHTGLGILLPGHDLAWVNTLPLKPNRAEIVASRKPINRPDAARVLAAAYRVFDTFPITHDDTDTSQAARNSLIVAFCVLFSLRLGDLTRIRIGEHLRRTGSRWRLMFPSDVKNGALLLFDVPPELTKRLELYLATWRPALLGSRLDHGHIWIARGGRPPREAMIAAGIDKFGRTHLGHPLNSHVFRHAFVVTTMIRNPADADLAAAGLGHTSEQMVQSCYSRSGSQELSKLWLTKLINRRKGR
jgi:integrase